MADFYDYYVSNGSEEMDGQEKTSHWDFKTRYYPVSNSTQGNNLQRNGKIGNYHALNASEEMERQKKAFQGNGKAIDYHALNHPEEIGRQEKTSQGDCMPKDRDKLLKVHGNNPEDGTGVRLQRDGKETAEWRCNVGDRGGNRHGMFS